MSNTLLGKMDAEAYLPYFLQILKALLPIEISLGNVHYRFTDYIIL